MTRRSIPVQRKIIYSLIVTVVTVLCVIPFVPDTLWQRFRALVGSTSREREPGQSEPGTIIATEERVARLEQEIAKIVEDRAIQQRASVMDAFGKATETEQKFLSLIGMTKDTMVVGRYVNLDWVASFPGRVFQHGTDGLPYQLIPDQRSHWMKPGSLLDRLAVSIQITPYDGPTRGFIEKNDEIRSDLVPGAIHTTNSWGLRGPEPRLNATLKILVLGDSYMHGYGVDDKFTAPRQLELSLTQTYEESVSVSVLNSAVSGYGPKEYYLSFEKYAERFGPHVVVVSVCQNDLGRAGQGKWTPNDPWPQGWDHWNRAGFYLRKILNECDRSGIHWLIVPVPEKRLLVLRKDDFATSLAKVLNTPGENIVTLLNSFVDADLENEIKRGISKSDTVPLEKELFLDSLNDGHMARHGLQIWAQGVSDRIRLLISKSNQQ